MRVKLCKIKVENLACNLAHRVPNNYEIYWKEN